MKYAFLFALLVGTILISGCTTLESTAIGAGGGAIIGNQVGSGHPATGAVIGGLAGALWGVSHSQAHRPSSGGSHYEHPREQQMSAGERAAYERGRAQENRAEQSRRERAAREAGRRDAQRENSWY